MIFLAMEKSVDANCCDINIEFGLTFKSSDNRNSYSLIIKKLLIEYHIINNLCDARYLTSIQHIMYYHLLHLVCHDECSIRCGWNTAPSLEYSRAKK